MENKSEIKTVRIGETGYPQQLTSKLKRACPQLFFYIGDLSLLDKKCLAVVGSREIDEAGRVFVEKIVKTAVNKGIVIVSGGAKGTDSLARDSALNNGGFCIEYLADNLAAKAGDVDFVDYISKGRLLCLSAEDPQSPFRAKAALARNKFIWAQSNAGVVSRCDFQKGGSWQGASNALRFHTAKVFVFDNKKNAGNQGLIALGAIPVDETWAVEI
jgi:predicted Rossmann fold nucleotide-binding protein DprA/Smf involved in DNA uptake